MAFTAYINLTKGDIRMEQSPAETVRKYLGSRGYAAKILYDNVGVNVEPLSPEYETINSFGPMVSNNDMEMPRQEPRTTKGMASAYSTSNRGSDYLYALPTIDLTGNVEAAPKLFPECMPEILERTSEKYKPEMNILSEAYCAVSDAFGICKFTTTEAFILYPEDIAEGLSEIYGFSIVAEGILKAVERIVNIELIYNVCHGFNRKNDQLPSRFLDEPVILVDMDTNEIISEGMIVDLDYMLDRYYRLRKWTADGISGTEKLTELWLEDLIMDLNS